MSEDLTLWVVAESEGIERVETTVSGARDIKRDAGGSFGKTAKETVAAIATRKRVPLDAIALKAQMTGLLNVVGSLFDQAEQQTGMKLTEVQLVVEINAEGQVSLVGTGGKIGSKGGITLKFTRE